MDNFDIDHCKQLGLWGEPLKLRSHQLLNVLQQQQLFVDAWHCSVSDQKDEQGFQSYF